MLVFLDLETTGLSPERDEVLEVAAICTDDQLVGVSRYQSIIAPFRPLHKLDEFVRDMHAKSGLLDELRALDNQRALASQFSMPRNEFVQLKSVDAQLAAWLRDHAVKIGTDEKGARTIDRPQLAGNTISFDRAFMKRHLPAAHAELHYRNVDCSTLNEMARRFWPKVYEGRPKQPGGAAHRAMADALESLQLARYYSSALTPVIVTVAAGVFSEVPCGAV